MDVAMRAKLEAVSTDPNETDAIRKAAVSRLKKHDRQKRTVAESTRKSRVSQRTGIARYQVGGVWKLTERIADWDANGQIVNGWSDRV